MKYQREAGFVIQGSQEEDMWQPGHIMHSSMHFARSKRLTEGMRETRRGCCAQGAATTIANITQADAQQHLAPLPSAMLQNLCIELK